MEKFEIGDKVVCIYNLGLENILELGKTYIISDIGIPERDVLLINGCDNLFYTYRFVSIPQYRKMKIEIIKSKILIGI